MSAAQIGRLLGVSHEKGFADTDGKFPLPADQMSVVLVVQLIRQSLW